MRIIFMGTPAFAVATLDALVGGNFHVVAVVTSPDKPAGRGQQLHESPVKQYANRRNIPVLQPGNLKDENFAGELKRLKADVQVVVAFRMLPEMIWNMPPLGTFNLHASLLPAYRGAAPINWAIIRGEKKTGVTTFKLRHEIDTGNILFQQSVDIGNETTAEELHDLLMQVGAQLMIKTMQALKESIRSGDPLKFTAQDDRLATHAPKIFRDTCRINWHESGAVIKNLVRGLCPYPAAFSSLQINTVLRTVKFFKVEFIPCDHSYSNGFVLTDGKSDLRVACKDGLVEVEEIQMEGKKRLHVAEFLRGSKDLAGSYFT
jgi:methionyl-tRNA formyltransferase